MKKKTTVEKPLAISPRLEIASRILSAIVANHELSSCNMQGELDCLILKDKYVACSLQLADALIEESRKSGAEENTKENTEIK